MPLSHYLKTYLLPETPGQRLLYSTRTTACCLVPEAEFAAIAHGRSREAIVAQLTTLGMIVPDLDRERQEVQALHAELNRLNTTIRVAMVLGLECNFACPYCYQGTLKGRHAMDDVTAEQTISFIKQRYRDNNTAIHLDFYGGETLLYHHRIRYLAGELKPFVESRGGRFEFSIVTNGSLLTPRMISELNVYGLTGIKVTLDGPAESHNRTRPFKNGRPSYAAIVNNLRAITGLTRITLGGNFTQENYHLFPRLLDDLIDQGLGPDAIQRVSFAPVVAVRDRFASTDFSDGFAASDEAWLADAILHVRVAALARGFRVPPIRPEVCAITIDDSCTINYDGGIYPCLPMAGRKECQCGDVVHGFADPAIPIAPAHWQTNPDCPECEYLPLCYGGCKFIILQRTGTMTGIDCQRSFFERALSGILSQDLMYRKK